MRIIRNTILSSFSLSIPHWMPGLLLRSQDVRRRLESAPFASCAVAKYLPSHVQSQHVGGIQSPPAHVLKDRRSPFRPLEKKALIQAFDV